MALVTLQRSAVSNAASSASISTGSPGEGFGNDDDQANNQSQSSFVMVRGAALVLRQEASGKRPLTPTTGHSFTGDQIQHLEVMINTLRSEDCVRLAVRLESSWTDQARYMLVVFARGRQDAEENVLLGVDFLSEKDSRTCSVGMVLPLWSDTDIRLEGDGGFSVNAGGRSHVFRPVSVQAMWSALQVLHKAREGACRSSLYPGSGALAWTQYYEGCLSSEQSVLNEWNAITDLESRRTESPAMSVDQPSDRERNECVIKAKLRSIMMDQDLESITSKEIRSQLEQQMSCDLKQYKEFVDQEILLIVGQMDKATLIFDHLYLGSEWNASNLDELQDCGVGYILNVSQEVDNFFPGSLVYHNIRVSDEASADLLTHWDHTHSFITRAKKSGSKVLVHCKMGVSRSVSTVVAYAMKEYGWPLDEAFNHVRQKRAVVQPNPRFMRQLAEYEAILDPGQRHNRRWRSEVDPETSDEGPASGLDAPEVSGEETPVLTGSSQEEEEAAWGCSGAMSLEVEPLDPLNYNYYFRRLSDSALESGPSTPVRGGPPLPGAERIFIAIEDVERDALLDEDEDGGFPPGRRPAPGGEAAAAQTCGRPDPMEDVRLRLEFSTLEEEDEEEARREEAEMAALARGEEGRLGFANLNTNNSNRLGSKRSCPAAFDDSLGFQNPFKVKPSYQWCGECLPLLPPHGRTHGRTHRLYTSRHRALPSITLDPPGATPASPEEIQDEEQEEKEEEKGEKDEGGPGHAEPADEQLV